MYRYSHPETINVTLEVTRFYWMHQVESWLLKIPERALELRRVAGSYRDNWGDNENILLRVRSMVIPKCVKIS